MRHVETLTAEERSIIEEEQLLLERAREALGRALAKAAVRTAGDLRSVDALRALRDEASRASEDDLPALLHEMTVRRELVTRSEAPLPDPQAPYFGHLRVREGRATKAYLLGSASLLDTAAGVRIVDWRVAPVAQIFYRHREGDEYEETFPGRVAEGVVCARRVVVVRGGRVEQIVGDGFALVRGDDGRWRSASRAALAEGGAGTAVRPGALGVGAGERDRAAPADVTALLDPEQYAAVATPPDEPLLVLGSAGSGKTTVALHRLARLVAGGPEIAARAHVVVPEEGLARLSRRLLDPLAPDARVSTLDAFALALARRVFGAPFPRVWTEAPGLVSSLKRHPALFDALHARLARVPASGLTLRKLRRRLADAFTDRAFLAGVVAASNGALPRSAVEETVRHTMLQIADTVDKQLAAVVVPEMKQAVDGRAIAEGTPEELADTIDAEDLPILLSIRAARAGLDATALAHLVLDEAGDFSLFELDVLRRLLEGRSVTVAGDEAQQTSASFAGWPRALELLGVPDAPRCRLAVSYRCPRPVAELARAVLAELAPGEPVRAAREGAPVGRFVFPEEGHALLFLAGALRDLVDREPRASVGVLAHDDATARRVHEVLAEVPGVRLVEGGAFTFEPGVDVAFAESAKGLEFDYVVVPDATAEAYPDTPEARRLLHVAVTRASHQLWLVSGGAPSPALPRA